MQADFWLQKWKSNPWYDKNLNNETSRFPAPRLHLHFEIIPIAF